ncbi:class I SAM-dependent methyltransferase [Thioalkalivibrio sp. HK1]|uniref:class I SAM-dependent methyltransferase n=1 Tax=Thioalkalivibrio sp. HK1 TaxID=1469245 RepID=UPI00046F457A|nr:class I SAM-dependent methyltransferase [Thioalkalivibrio sp. HK1]
MSEGTTHFGFEEIPVGEKARRVDAVFDSVADRYDLMNDLMSLGLHRVWKHFAVHLARVRKDMRVLDLAAGTGDLSLRMAPMVGPGGRVVLADSNRPMLAKGRDRLLDKGHVGTIEAVRCDAQRLPFPDRTFDRVLIGFGLRNITHKERALAEMRRVLRPSGMALVLEFSRLTLPLLAQAYDLWSFRALPLLGRVVVGDADSYRYLAESIRRHPDQETLLATMREAGFEHCTYHNLCGGVVAVHKGYRL